MGRSELRQPQSQLNHWDRGRLARKRAAGAKFFALRAHCGRDARGPSKRLNRIVGYAELLAHGLTRGVVLTSWDRYTCDSKNK